MSAPGAYIFDPLPRTQFDAYAAAQLSWRAGFGGAWAEFEAMAKDGPEAAVSRLLDFDPQTQPQMPDFVKLPDLSEKDFGASLKALSPERRAEAENKRRSDEAAKIRDLKLWWLGRMRGPGRPLEEKMTLFWHSHFATAFGDKITQAFPMWRQNQFFRSHALSPFPEILIRLIEDPAMLVWLDNWSSRKDHPNENFARELMELFSLGVGNYSESDVKAAARALTGYTIDRESWTFVFNDEMHDSAAKTYLGETGEWDGGAITRLIWKQAASSRFIARKLLAFFLYDPPEEALVAEAARLLREADTKEMLRALFLSRVFYSEKARAMIVKSPVVLAVGALKSMEEPLLPDPRGDTLLSLLRLMGQDLFAPPDVNGWVEGLAWINSNLLLLRYNFSNYLLNGVSADQFRAFDPRREGGAAKRREFVENQRSQGLVWSPHAQITRSADVRKLLNSGDIVDWFIRQFLARRVPEDMRRDLINYVETDASGGRRSFSLHDEKFDERTKGLVHLIMSSPDYQLC